jgi:hypothetical protein
VLKYVIPAIRNSDFLTGNHTCMHIKVSLLSEFKSHINVFPNDNFFKVRMINVILNCFKKLAPGSIVKRTF